VGATRRHVVGVRTRQQLVDIALQYADAFPDRDQQVLEFFIAADEEYVFLRHSRVERVLVTCSGASSLGRVARADLTGHLRGRGKSAPIVFGLVPHAADDCPICRVARTQNTLFENRGKGYEALSSISENPNVTEPGLMTEAHKSILVAAMRLGWTSPDRDVTLPAGSEPTVQAVKKIVDKWARERPFGARGATEDALAWLFAKSAIGEPPPPEILDGMNREQVLRLAFARLVEFRCEEAARERPRLIGREARTIVLFEGAADQFRRFLQGLLICDPDGLGSDREARGQYDSFGFPDTANFATSPKDYKEGDVIAARDEDAIRDVLSATASHSVVQLIVPPGMLAAARSIAEHDGIALPPGHQFYFDATIDVSWETIRPFFELAEGCCPAGPTLSEHT
jgi:hypothetical protein